MQRVDVRVSFIVASLLGVCLFLVGCSTAEETRSTEMATSTAAVTEQPTVTPLPTLTLDDTLAKGFEIRDFEAIHAVDKEDANKYLIFGNMEVKQTATGLPDELAALLGRWEGYSYAPPVKKERKLVLMIQQIDLQGGKAYTWSGTNLQYPDSLEEIEFRVVWDEGLVLEWQLYDVDGSQQKARLRYDAEKEALEGWTTGLEVETLNNPCELTRKRSFYVYKEYAKYLESKRITTKTYKNNALSSFGMGYMVYLPEGYEESTDKSWPLLFFLHDYRERGDNALLLANASPFMYIRENGVLPMIIAAPLLNSDNSYVSFPEEYLDGVLAEMRSEYRVDAQRVYVSGLSMGGEATWRFALHQPQTFAAIAPLCGYFDQTDLETMKMIKDVPVWAYHGANDVVVPVIEGQSPVVALKKVGGNVRFSILEEHDHDVWTDTYSDPAFYDWLLQNQRP